VDRYWVLRHLAFLGPKFTKFLLELWSLAAGTLFQGLESYVGKQFLPLSLVTIRYLYYEYSLVQMSFKSTVRLLVYFFPNISTIEMVIIFILYIFFIHEMLQLVQRPTIPIYTVSQKPTHTDFCPFLH